MDWSHGRGFPRFAPGAGRPPGRTLGAPNRPRRQGASPSLASKRPKGPGNEDQKTDEQLRTNEQRRRRHGPPRPEAGPRVRHTEDELIRGGRPRRIFWPWGSAQALEKARSGERNPRISLAQIWPGFAGFGPGFAGFGFAWKKFGSTDPIWSGADSIRQIAGGSTPSPS
jgi:hypothetical protein